MYVKFINNRDSIMQTIYNRDMHKSQRRDRQKQNGSGSEKHLNSDLLPWSHINHSLRP